MAGGLGRGGCGVFGVGAVLVASERKGGQESATVISARAGESMFPRTAGAGIPLADRILSSVPSVDSTD